MKRVALGIIFGSSFPVALFAIVFSLKMIVDEAAYQGPANPAEGLPYLVALIFALGAVVTLLIDFFVFRFLKKAIKARALSGFETTLIAVGTIAVLSIVYLSNESFFS